MAVVYSRLISFNLMNTSLKDVYEPLEQYRDVFCEKFKLKAAETFRELVERSGIDKARNKALSKKIYGLQNGIKKLEKKHSWYQFGIFTTIFLIFGGFIGAAHGYSTDKTDVLIISAVVFAVSLIILFASLLPARKKLRNKINEAKMELESTIAEAYSRMEALHNLYEWDLIPNIIEEVVPRLQFDSFLHEGRLRELRDYFGWDDSFNADRSVITAHCGEIIGNPFVFARTRRLEWGEKEYVGERTVHWTETERDPDGKRRTVTKSQTLTAVVVKPYPYYVLDNFLIYGNEAAPALTFSRVPSELSDDGNGFFAKAALRRKIKKLEKFSRNLDDDSNYTIMANKEFEALFCTTDRNNEQQFRLLFTPLAQRQIVALLRDKEVGYGDDFVFLKDKKINIIEPEHLKTSPIDTDPKHFYHFDLEKEEEIFNDFAREYFKSTYFALAPLLSIPLYQQTRTFENIYGENSRYASFWEHEALTNYIGAERFAHPKSDTESILKTEIAGRDGNRTQINVTAHSHYGKERTTTKSVMARNGRSYNVDVNWKEYLELTKTTQIGIAEFTDFKRCDYLIGKTLPNDEWRNFYNTLGAAPEHTHYRRTLLASFK